MFIFKNNINLLIVLIFISSCSTLNVTQESVSSENIITIETSGPKDDYINYDSQAVFANATIYFEFDKSNLTSKSIQTLRSAVNALKENSSIKITLAGHADERGTREYNLALGQRRAEIVSDYLVLNGIQNQRITVKSYGEERPAVIGQDEQSYAKNRRVDIN
tara:strand:- start:665 stop:1153 length:489 start_codon:yes stop_codon:yes gene_type:complete